MVSTVDDIQTTQRIETPPVLEVNNLSVHYHTSRGPVKAVENVSSISARTSGLGWSGNRAPANRPSRWRFCA
jgi:ABC-type glutathione transport system ATPase component